MAWPILCETEQIKRLLETPYVQGLFHITKIDMSKADASVIKIQGKSQEGKTINATFKVIASGEPGTGCPTYTFEKKK